MKMLGEAGRGLAGGAHSLVICQHHVPPTLIFLLLSEGEGAVILSTRLCLALRDLFPLAFKEAAYEGNHLNHQGGHSPSEVPSPLEGKDMSRG